MEGYKVGDLVEVIKSNYLGGYLGTVAKILKVNPTWVTVDVNPANHKQGLTFTYNEIKLHKETKVLKILRQWRDLKSETTLP